MNREALRGEVEALLAEMSGNRETVTRMTREEAEEALAKPGRPVTRFSEALISQLRGERLIGEGRCGFVAMMDAHAEAAE